mgnify:FL=1
MCTLTTERNDAQNEGKNFSSHSCRSYAACCRVYRGAHSYDCVCREWFLSVNDIVRDTGVSLLFFCLQRQI